MANVPRVMSTQHPDNISMPFFANGDTLAGEDEIKEAYFAFSQLGATEQMWDSEGKDVDDQVVEKLLSRYTEFFQTHTLGKDFRLTYRVPNPSVQKEQGKILLETLQTIPRAYDVAKLMHDVPPVFEVILPMTTSAQEVDLVKNYYEKIIIGQKNMTLVRGKTIKDWVGDFQPETINVIPLFENLDSIWESADIVKDYLKGKRIEEQRVFLARSDPALNYGSVSAVLMDKVALMNLDGLQEEESVEILPILGVGGTPFRGNFNPNNVSNCMDGYPSVQTFTIQSSFKFDNPFRDVVNAVDLINKTKRGKARVIDEMKAESIINKIKDEYQEQILLLADYINKIAAKLPNRRARKLHIGLFGYSRSMGGVKMPRAIKFCGALYSLGIPPEILGLGALNAKDMDQVRGMYKNVDKDIADSLKYLNKGVLDKMPSGVKKHVNKALEHFEYEIDGEHEKLTSRIYSHLSKNEETLLSEDVIRSAWMRKTIG